MLDLAKTPFRTKLTTTNFKLNYLKIVFASLRPAINLFSPSLSSPPPKMKKTPGVSSWTDGNLTNVSLSRIAEVALGLHNNNHKLNDHHRVWSLFSTHTTSAGRGGWNACDVDLVFFFWGWGGCLGLEMERIFLESVAWKPGNRYDGMQRFIAALHMYLTLEMVPYLERLMPITFMVSSLWRA